MSPPLHLEVPDEATMEALGGALAAARRGGLRIHLRGDLGTGKTTLTRGFLRAAGYGGTVRSPTYTLVEPYELAEGATAYHLDLYRLSAGEELEFLGVRDLEHSGAVLLVEWPERAAGALPGPDLELVLQYAEPGRRVTLEAGTARGAALLARLTVPAGCRQSHRP